MTHKNQNTEYETKVLDFDAQVVIQKLRELGAKETAEVLLKRWVFDFSNSEHARWLRLRTDGSKTHLTFKKKPKRNTIIGKTEEIEVEVQDFDLTYAILSQVSFDKLFYQENKRQKFELDGIELHSYKELKFG